MHYYIKLNHFIPVISYSVSSGVPILRYRYTLAGLMSPENTRKTHLIRPWAAKKAYKPLHVIYFLDHQNLLFHSNDKNQACHQKSFKIQAVLFNVYQTSHSQKPCVIVVMHGVPDL